MRLYGALGSETAFLIRRHRTNLMHGETFFLRYCRLTPTGKKIPLRVFMSNGSGYYLDFNIYREVTDPRTGQVLMALAESHIFPDVEVILLTHFVTVFFRLSLSRTDRSRVHIMAFQLAHLTSPKTTCR